MRFLLPLLSALWCGELDWVSSRAAAQTLFRWSSAPDVVGGPNLDEPLVTDRPDFTEAAVTVGQGVVQLEAGYTYTFDNDGVDQTIGHSYPEALWRVGFLADWLELRFAWSYANQPVNGFIFSGSEDIYLGTKIALTGQVGFLPEMAIIPQATVPTGHENFTADEFLPGFNWLYAWEVCECISTGGSTQFNRVIDEGTEDAYTEWAQSWTIAYSMMDRVGAYTEWFSLIPHSADTAQTQSYFDGGLTYLVTDNFQLDIRAGIGLNDAADDYFAGTGFSIRFK